MMRKNIGLRTNHCSCRKRQWPSPSTACAGSNFTAKSLYFGGPQLQNGSAVCCPLPSIRPMCHNPASLGAANTATKLQFASTHRFFQKGNGSMHERAIMLELLILIRICSRDPGKHMLLKKHLEGVSGDPFAFRGVLAIAAVTCFSAATVCFFSFGSCF